MWYWVILLHPLILLWFLVDTFTSSLSTVFGFLYLSFTILYVIALGKDAERWGIYTRTAERSALALSVMASFGTVSVFLTPWWLIKRG